MFHKLKSALAAVITLAVVAPAATAQDQRPDLVVAVNNLPGSLEGIEEMGNVAVRITYSMYDLSLIHI